MKLLNLKLRGNIGVKKGLGLEEIEIDFRRFGSGLIAITGRNGSGKTSILEQCHPYRQLVSRDGSLQSHFFLKDSYRILEFEYNNSKYESRILIDALTGKSEAYLFHLGDDGSRTPINDGKASTYDVEIEKLLGSSQLFFNSVFSGQKSKGIAELKPADRRKLFYELLNLNSYEVYLEQAKQQLKSVENDLAKVEGEISALQQDQTSIDILEEERKDKLEYQAQLISDITELEQGIENKNNAIRETEVKLGLAKEKAESNKRIGLERTELEARILEVTKQHNEKIIRYQSEIEDQKKLIERFKKLADPAAKDKVEVALQEKKELTSKLDALRRVASNLEKGYSDFQKEYSQMLKVLSSVDKQLSEAKLKEKSVLNNLDNLNRQTKDCENSVALISKVPCDEETGRTCQFLKNAYESGNKLDQLLDEKNKAESELKSRMSDVESLKADYNHKKEMLDSFFDDKDNYFRGSIHTNSEEIKSVEKELSAINKYNYEKLLDEIKEADNQIKLCEQSISGNEKLIAEAKISFDQAVSQIKAQIEDLNKKYDETILLKIEHLNSDLILDKQKHSGLQQQLAASKSRLDEAKQDVTKLEQLIEANKKNEERIAKLLESKVKIESEIKDWTFLCKAFDKTGIPVLKLENSGIEITSVANELLSIFENKFRIVFETTKLKADKKSYKESFDINIVEDDGVCEISNKSGGQQVWLETAIQLAISLVVRNQGRNIQTAFLDEKDGALDLDNAFSYIEMLRKAHAMSGVHNTFIITHRPELLDFIPQQVKLTDGVLEVVN